MPPRHILSKDLTRDAHFCRLYLVWESGIKPLAIASAKVVRGIASNAFSPVPGIPEIGTNEACTVQLCETAG